MRYQQSEKTRKKPKTGCRRADVGAWRRDSSQAENGRRPADGTRPSAVSCPAPAGALRRASRLNGAGSTPSFGASIEGEQPPTKVGGSWVGSSWVGSSWVGGSWAGGSWDKSRWAGCRPARLLLSCLLLYGSTLARRTALGGGMFVMCSRGRGLREAIPEGAGVTAGVSGFRVGSILPTGLGGSARMACRPSVETLGVSRLSLRY